MERITESILGHTAYMDVSEFDDEVTAGYLDSEDIMDDVTFITREEEHGEDEHGKYFMPEETDTDPDIWQKYYDALADWVSHVRGIERSLLNEAYSVDVPEPFLRYRP